MKDQIDTWLKIGKENPWIQEACDPPFTRESFKECGSLDELEAFFEFGNWCLGMAVYFGNICFIQQVDGGDEWLVIKDDVAFESFSCNRMIKNGTFIDNFDRIQRASLEECRQLEY